MQQVSQLILDVRDLGESIVSTCQDIQQLLRIEESIDIEKIQKFKHTKILVENVLSLLACFSTMDFKCKGNEQLTEEVRKIEFSCFGLQSILSQMLNDISLYQKHARAVNTFLRIINKSAHRIITISFIVKESVHSIREPSDFEIEGGKVCYKGKHICEQNCGNSVCVEEECGSEEGNVCYKDKNVCEQNCDKGVCLEEECGSECESETNCPQQTETFSESPFVHVENGHVEQEKLYLGRTNIPDNIDDIVRKGNGFGWWNIFDYYKKERIPRDKSLRHSYDKSDILQHSMFNNQIGLEEDANTACLNTTIQYEAIEKQKHEDFENNNETNKILGTTTNSSYPSHITEPTKTVMNEQSTKTAEDSPNSYYKYDVTKEITTPSQETTTTYDEKTTSSYNLDTTEDSTTPSHEISSQLPEMTTSAYNYSGMEEGTTPILETTTEITNSYYSSYTAQETTTFAYETTTPTYETTTQDLYKISQDIYSVAQDLSTKANEISSMTSDISSKVSDINSMVNDLNSYDDEELSKKVQAVSKLTQEINSKTSEISSLCSTTSSLASDISSASSDMTNTDRNHPFRITPWQKMASKSQDMITSTQAIISAAQDILVKVDNIVNTVDGMKVAEAAATAGFEITAKIQRVISETLNIVSAVIELMNVVES